MMRVVDWRELSPEQTAALYAEETREWAGSLGWDLTASWGVVERARAAGALPGRACVNAQGAVLAWTFFMRQGTVLQIGALTGKGATPVRAMLEAVLDAPEAAGARELTCLLYPARTNVLSALARRRFDLQTLRYLARPSSAADEPVVAPEHVVIRRWADEDAIPAVRVLARAYGRSESGRGLAPNGTLEEWAHYLGQVLRTPACGTLLPRASFVAEDERTGAALGFVLATSIGPATAHVAQLAVDADWTRKGIGRALLRSVSKASVQAGFTSVSLLVTDANASALNLYRSEQFNETGRFVFAGRTMPVRRQVQPRAA
jgi:ribosomal protein S18 acetylase RimI-like enzyme